MIVTARRAWTAATSATTRSPGCFARTALLLQAALTAIASSLAAFARACIQAGADGIFLAVRDDWVDRPENGAGLYDQMVRPLDLDILAAVAGAPFNILHVCGRPLDLEAFARYPAHVLNWEDRAAGPRIADVAGRIKPVIAAGVDNLNTLPKGTPQDCATKSATPWPKPARTRSSSPPAARSIRTRRRPISTPWSTPPGAKPDRPPPRHGVHPGGGLSTSNLTVGPVMQLRNWAMSPASTWPSGVASRSKHWHG